MKEKEILNPQDADLEEAVIGACMVESEAIALVADKLRPEMFYTEVNGMIFAAVQSMFHAGKKIDILTVKSELAARGALEKVGGPYNLTRIASRIASGTHVEYHACILRELFIRREMIIGSHKQLAAAADESVDITDALGGIHDLLDHLEGDMGTADHLRTMGQLMEDTLAQVETRVEGSRDGITGIPTGFSDLDKLTSGWQRGDLNIIAARPAVGKRLLPFTWRRLLRQPVIIRWSSVWKCRVNAWEIAGCLPLPKMWMPRICAGDSSIRVSCGRCARLHNDFRNCPSV